MDVDIYIVVDVAAAKKKHVAITTRISGLTRQSAVSILVRTRMYFAEMNDITDVHNVYETRRQCGAQLRLYSKCYGHEQRSTF